MFPPIETGILSGDLVFRQHSAGHTPNPNWPYFLAFAEREFKDSYKVRAHISRRRFALIAGTAGVTPLAMAGAEPLTAEAVSPAHSDGTGRRLAVDRSGRLQGGRPFHRGEGNRHHRHGDARRSEAGGEGERESDSDLRADILRTRGRSTAGGAGRDAGRRGLAPTILSSKQNANSSRRTAWSSFACATTGRRAKRTIWSPALRARSAGRTHRVKNDDALYDIPPATAEATVALIRGKLNLRGGLRAVGDRKATIRRVLLFPGLDDSRNHVAALFRSGHDRRR